MDHVWQNHRIDKATRQLNFEYISNLHSSILIVNEQNRLQCNLKTCTCTDLYTIHSTYALSLYKLSLVISFIKLKRKRKHFRITHRTLCCLFWWILSVFIDTFLANFANSNSTSFLFILRECHVSFFVGVYSFEFCFQFIKFGIINALLSVSIKIL